jgi:hypothetical protein
MEEHGNSQRETEEDSTKGAAETKEEDEAKGAPEKSAALMQEEERFVGSVSWSTYSEFFKYAGGLIWMPIVLLWLVVGQGFQGE